MDFPAEFAIYNHPSNIHVTLHGGRDVLALWKQVVEQLQPNQDVQYVHLCPSDEVDYLIAHGMLIPAGRSRVDEYIVPKDVAYVENR